MTNGNGKIPLYDELSIPFIDASLPPTPKVSYQMQCFSQIVWLLELKKIIKA